MSDVRKEADRWLAQASREMEAGQSLLEHGFYWLVCFQAHQVAERAIKGYLWGVGDPAPRINSIVELATQAAKHCAGLRDIAPVACRLDQDFYQTRHPDLIPGGVPADQFTRSQALEALDRAQYVLSVVKEALEDG